MSIPYPGRIGRSKASRGPTGLERNKQKEKGDLVFARRINKNCLLCRALFLQAHLLRSYACPFICAVLRLNGRVGT